MKKPVSHAGMGGANSTGGVVRSWKDGLLARLELMASWMHQIRKMNRNDAPNCKVVAVRLRQDRRAFLTSRARV